MSEVNNEIILYLKAQMYLCKSHLGGPVLFSIKTLAEYALNLPTPPIFRPPVVKALACKWWKIAVVRPAA